VHSHVACASPSFLKSHIHASVIGLYIYTLSGVAFSAFLVMVGCVDIAFVDSCFHEIISSFIYHIEKMQSIIDF